jgi:hypothetical protein
MNRLSTEKRVQVISALVEGVSINATCRMSGVAKHTILKLIEDIGMRLRRVSPSARSRPEGARIQCDEIWQFVGAKAKNAKKSVTLLGPSSSSS